MTRCFATRLSVVAMMLVTPLAAGLRAQGQGTIAGVVVTQDGAPLAYAIVALPALGRERFTNDAGAFVLPEVPAGRVVLRVRRLGYLPMDVPMHVSAGRTDSVRVALNRVAVRLATVNVTSHPPCRKPGAPKPTGDSTLYTVYSQLVLNAEQYKLLSETYPFVYALSATRSQVMKDGTTTVGESDTTHYQSDVAWKYVPGGVLRRDRDGKNRVILLFTIPTLLNFADPLFARSHCFHNGGLVKVGDSSFVRIDVVAADNIKTPDVNGTILLNPSTFQIRQTVLRLTRPQLIQAMTDAEVMTEFRELLPSIPVIHRVTSAQTFDPGGRGVTFVSAHEEQELIVFAFRGQKPGEEKKP
jgi:hypothetical protein